MAGISSKAVGPLINKKGYNGNELQSKEFSDGSGLELYDFNARTYDQQIGRFIQIDPESEEADQESWSPYHFGYNNPIRYNDPDGEFPIETIWDVGNLIWDAGKAVVKHIQGDHKAARASWVDAGADLAATFIPYVPAGATKLFKGVGKALDAGKAAKTISKEAVERGVKNETKVLKDMGVPKNNRTFKTIDPKTGKQVNVKPDGIDKTKVVEVKDTKRVSNTSQIRGERQVAQQQGKDFKIVTGQNTKVSKTIPKTEVIRRPDIGPQ